MKKSVKERKRKLEVALAEQKSISLEDEQWLDNNADLVDGQRIISRLEKTTRYEDELESLGERDCGEIEKMGRSLS